MPDCGGPGAGAVGRGASEPCFDEEAAAAHRITACTQLIETSKDNATLAQAFLQRGVLREQGGESETAVTDYSEAIKLAPANALAHFNRANAQDQLRRFEEAIADYSQAIKLDPKEPDYFNNRGQAYDHKGQHDQAIADYTEAIKLDADNARPLYNRGLSFANKGDYRRAIADFDQAIKLSPDDADLYVARGAAHEEVGEADAAKADFGKALEIDPTARTPAKASTGSAVRFAAWVSAKRVTQLVTGCHIGLRPLGLTNLRRQRTLAPCRTTPSAICFGSRPGARAMAPPSAAWSTAARPALRLTSEDIQLFLDKRRPGQSRFTTQRREPDTVRILSGVFADEDGRQVTTGAPISLVIDNIDQRGRDYDDIKDKFRPGHADFTYWEKYGVRTIAAADAPAPARPPCAWPPVPSPAGSSPR